MHIELHFIIFLVVMIFLLIKLSREKYDPFNFMPLIWVIIIIAVVLIYGGIVLW